MATKETPATHPASSSALVTYRPLLERAIFVLALLGVLVASHITIQESRGFEGGCTGFAPSQSGFDCAAVTQSEAATLFGIPNSVWGILFYSTLVLLTAAAAFDSFGARRAFKSGRALMIGFGFIYSMYLVYYQFAVLEELCLLCLTSAGIVTLIFILQLVDILRLFPLSPSDPSVMTVSSKREVAYMGAIGALVLVLIGADAVYFGSPDIPEPYIPPAEMPSHRVADTRTNAEVNSTLPAECRYDVDRGPVEDYLSLVNFFDPARGNPSAPVTVIEYFDPNCPHCKTLHSIMEEVIQTHSDQAYFVFKPFFLWQHSIAQSEALYAAAQEGKFFEMLDHQFALQKPQTGLSTEDLRQIAADIGMDPDALVARLERGIYRGTLVQEKQKGVAIGINSTPTVLINGRFVSVQSRSADCLRTMIEAAAES